MADQASAMMKETADNCRSALVPAEYPALRKLLDRAACDLEAAASIIFHNIEARCQHFGRTHNTGGWHCPDCGMRGPAKL